MDNTLVLILKKGCILSLKSRIYEAAGHILEV